MAEQVHPQDDVPVIDGPATLTPALVQAVECSSDGIVLLDDQWRISFANLAARTISRIRPEDFNSKTHWELYPDTIGTEIERTYREVMSTRIERDIPAVFYEPFQIWLRIRVMPPRGDRASRDDGSTAGSSRQHHRWRCGPPSRLEHCLHESTRD
jgi:PAS domain-containing protein